MKLSLLKFVVLVGTLALGACRPDPLGPTGVQVDLLTQDARLFATSFNLMWLDEKERLFEVRVPEEGTLDDIQAPAVSVFIALSPDKVGTRRLVVRGFKDGTPVSEGAARLIAGANVWLQIGIKMGPFGALPDADGDGLPDGIDNCPRERDPCGSMPPGPELDAGMGEDAQPDAEVIDQAIEARPPDARPDASPEMGTNFPNSFIDGGADKPKSDMRAN